MSHISSPLPEIDSLADLLPAFEFDRLIGQDVSGALYKACHRSLDRDVAIKFLPCDTGRDSRFRDSFQAKAKVMASLTHPSLLRVYDSGDLDGHLYTVMEYAHCRSLKDCAQGVAVDPLQAVEIVTSACLGLAYAHENGIIHGDIKPANIYLNSKCEPKIGNFGLPGHARNDAGALLSDAPEYMAPEIVGKSQCGGPKADVFSLGVILKELLTGIPAGSEDAAQQTLADPKLDAICRMATHPDPASRYPDTRSLADELKLWMASRKSSPAIAKPQPSFQRQASANRPATPSFPSPRIASYKKRQSKGSWTLAKSSLMILPLLCAGFLTQHILQNGIQQAAPQQAAQSEPTVIPITDTESGLAALSTMTQEFAMAISGNEK
jgi:serine/threonine protein kinase